MVPVTKTIGEIQARVARGEAVVYTAAELKELAREGEKISVENVDVVTTGTFGVMSGTLAILHVPVSGPGSFNRAEKAWLNGVPAIPGPCPNERLGSADLVVFGTSRADDSYGGGHLFRDLVAGSPVEVEIEAEGRTFTRSVSLKELDSARLITTRSAFKNYGGFINRNPGEVRTIFSVMGLSGPSEELSFSGCGDINPLQNDPSLMSIGVGTRILLNGGIGYILGQGTRSIGDKPNISASADMHRMIPEMMGGFVTSQGPECTSSVAVPIPVLNETILSQLLVTNEEIPLPVSDINDRIPVATSHYGEVWNGTDLTVTYSPDSCIRCEECEAAKYCPTGAISPHIGIDPCLCVNCGTCVKACPGGAFHGYLGNVLVGQSKVPVTLRQSDRSRALRLCEYLRDLILDKKFQVNAKLEDL